MTTWQTQIFTLIVKVALSWEIAVALVLGGAGGMRAVLPPTVAKGRVYFARVHELLIFNASPGLTPPTIRDSMADCSN